MRRWIFNIKQNVKIKIFAVSHFEVIRLTINEKIKKVIWIKVRQLLDISLTDSAKSTFVVAKAIIIKYKERDSIADTFV